jgi:radical S-adenosyl methionine domain-containing protein 2
MGQVLGQKGVIPSVNFFLTGACNMRCKFCFAPPQVYPPIGRAGIESVIDECASIGIQKITFVGGEPLLYPFLPSTISYAKDAGLTTCVVTNGSLLTHTWLSDNAAKLDWLGMSVDSLSPAANIRSGRAVTGKPVTADHYRSMAIAAKELSIKLKVNTTVSAWTWMEDLSTFIKDVQPDRWKIFQALSISGLNSHHTEDFAVTRAQFENFVMRHQHLSGTTTMVAETTEDMTESYLMISPSGRFFDNAGGKYRYSRPILEVGISEALSDISADRDRFLKRGGKYEWGS